jgi:hypothetical protein
MQAASGLVELCSIFAGRLRGLEEPTGLVLGGALRPRMSRCARLPTAPGGPREQV